jgi:hypothetical protein
MPLSVLPLSCPLISVLINVFSFCKKKLARAFVFSFEQKKSSTGEHHEKKIFISLRCLLKLKIMSDKIINLILDVVKYVFTIMLVYPLLSGMERDWEYYTVVGIAVVGGIAGAFLVKHFAKKNDKKRPNSKHKYRYKYKYKHRSKP